MQLRIVARDAHFNQPTVKEYPSKISNEKTSAMRNVHILCSNCPPLQARSLFRHSPTALLLKCLSGLSHSSPMRSRSLFTSVILVLYARSCHVGDVAYPRSCSPPGSRQDCLVATSLEG